MNINNQDEIKFMNIKSIKNLLKIIAMATIVFAYLYNPRYSDILKVHAFPIYAQQGYENPREATGRIVCANCHLAQKPVLIETPKAVLPNSVFEAKVNIPYDNNTKQILGNSQQGSLNMGAVLILPEGFKLAPKNLLSAELKEKTKKIYIQPYSKEKENILVIGPIPGNINQEIVFPILSPDPSTNKNIHFLKYPIYVGGNRGRGQIYPTGDKSNNNVITSSHSGKIVKITKNELNNYSIDIESNNVISTEMIPNGLEIKVKEGDYIKINDNLTNDPNFGGFGQNETEIVLQSPNRIKGMIIFFFAVTLAQIFFVLKKKQWEKVQAAEMNF